MVSDWNNDKDNLLSLVELHEEWRGSCLNLVAAENSMSPLARKLLSSDVAQRYGDYTDRNLRERRYFGTKYIAEIEIEVERLALELFSAKFVELRPISGHIAGDAVIMALCEPGDLVFELGRYDGGHRLATKLAQSSLINLNVEFLPFDPHKYNIDISRSLEMIRRRKPKLVIVGASNFLFPVPLRELAEGIRDLPEIVLAYDASHVLGLIAGRAFQEPLKEGAQIMMGGTQKSFPGPQGGLILSNSEEFIEKISGAVHPSILSNHHLAHLQSLGVALIEMKFWGEEYAHQVIQNAKVLAAKLADNEVSIVGDGNRYTESHTVLINTSTYGDSNLIGKRLEEAGIITTSIRLPKILGGTGLRLGTNEVTRRGAKPRQMEYVANLIADVLFGRRDMELVKKDVREIVENDLNKHLFTWPE